MDIDYSLFKKGNNLSFLIKKKRLENLISRIFDLDIVLQFSCRTKPLFLALTFRF